MSTPLYAEQDADFRFKGDYVLIDGTLTVVGDVSLTGRITVQNTSGTTAGVAWTSGAPALTAGQKYFTVKSGTTTYRIPLWADA